MFKSKSYAFHNRNIGIFSGNDTRMAGYFIGIHRYLRMRKALLAKVSSDEFNTMALHSKLSKVISYIKDKKAWERIYVLLKILSPCLRVICQQRRNGQGILLTWEFRRSEERRNSQVRPYLGIPIFGIPK